MSTLRIDVATMLDKIARLKEEKAKMDEVLANVKGESLKIADYWSGKGGEAAKDSLDKHINDYDFIRSKLQAQISFLERVVANYKKEDKDTVTAFDRNNNISAI